MACRIHLKRRATAAYDYVDQVVKGTDAMLAQAQRDVRKFLQMDQELKRVTSCLKRP